MMEIKAFSVYWWPHAEISLTFTWGKSGLQRIRRFRHRHGKIHLTSSAFMVSRERKSLSGTVAVAVWPFSLRGLLHWLPLCRLGHCVNQSFFFKWFWNVSKFFSLAGATGANTATAKWHHDVTRSLKISIVAWSSADLGKGDNLTRVTLIACNLMSTDSCKVQNSKKNSAPAWKIKSRRNKKRITQFVCKSRDESNEPN